MKTGSRYGKGLVVKSIIMCLVMLLSVVSFGVVSGVVESTSEEYLEGKLLIRTGTIDENHPPPWDEKKENIKYDDMGDYIAIRFARDAWFFVRYGNEDNNNGIMMATFQLRYLGGATIVTESGDTVVNQIGIPVVTVYGQGLIGLIEFQDEGYQETNMFFEDVGDPKGAHNNLWDFQRTNDGLENWNNSFVYTEPVIKALELNTSWTLSDFTKTEHGNSEKIEIDFTLIAEDMEYGDGEGKVWDQEFENDETEDTEVEKVEFTFHIEVKVQKNVRINDIPWYTVTIKTENDEIEVIDSKIEQYRDFSGDDVNAEFKFDHYIEGWDYKNTTKDSKLMLETATIFGTFIPDVVNDWFNKQFITEIDDALGVAEYSYNNSGKMVDAVIIDEGELPNHAQLIQKEHVTFKDNWRQVGNMSWINNAEVDGSTQDIYFQIHAGQNISGRGENDDGHFHALVILGGYIYPQGSVIFHDPTFIASALNIPGLSKISLNLLSEGGICLQALIAVIAIVVSMVILVRRRNRDKMLKAKYDGANIVHEQKTIKPPEPQK